MNKEITELRGLYSVSPATESEYDLIPRRRAPIRPLPGLTMHDANYMKERAFDYAELNAFMDCWTFEPFRRPIPFVATDKKPERALSAFVQYAPDVLKFLLPNVSAHTQTYNKISRLGYPVHVNPKTPDQVLKILNDLGVDRSPNDDRVDSLTGLPVYDKMTILFALFDELDAGDDSRYRHSFSTLGGRLQYEDPDHKRNGLFISDEGVVYEADITRADRTMFISEIGRDMVGSRYRGVVNAAIINLYIQNWDTMLHGTIMKYPLCDSNVYTDLRWPHDAEFTTFDCKHYERYLGRIVFEYAKLIGGRYGTWLTKLASDPYLVLSDSRRRAFKVQPRFGPGQYPQFGSGIACVADLGKLVNICVRVAFYHEVSGLSKEEAVRVTMSGTHDGLRHWMYGDDNRVQGDSAKREQFTKYMGQYFDIEIDDHPKYLGTVWRQDLDMFRLPSTTYNLKLYLRERDFSWYTYPHLGNVERRETFRRYGEPEIATDIIPFEDELFNEVGHPYYEMVAGAAKEKRESNLTGINLDEKEVTDKEYLMTAEEQVASGRFWGLPPSRTAEIAKQIVSQEVANQLRI